jgi:diaminohydroxyphosphoribosylaminopyrimidine deaminase/5-amino-6-(5-phosphoribosylamino)uracil reductase
MVGCVIADGPRTISEGWHQKYGGPHAEIEALKAGGSAVAGATMYVTLEPCSHHGKTPPCTEAIIEAQVRRVVVAQRDPFPPVDGSGLRRLEVAGLDVDVGLLSDQAAELNAPYRKLLAAGRPWVIAKWAMTMDGKIASRSGDSQWISCEASRAVAHRLRGRVDAVLVGRGTAQADDPLLTARPPGPRTAARIVLDSQALLSSDSQLVRTAGDAPVLVAAGPESTQQHRLRLTEAGCELFVCEAASRQQRLLQLLDELGRRRMTNVLVEGGGQLLGSLFDAGEIDEVHVFIAPKLIGGGEALPPVGGTGLERLAQAAVLKELHIEQLDTDAYLSGRLQDRS